MPDLVSFGHTLSVWFLPVILAITLLQFRLQRRWVRHWVQEPAIIQVGNARLAMLQAENSLRKFSAQAGTEVRPVTRPRTSPTSRTALTAANPATAAGRSALTISA